jgi:hypothetical protein
VCAPITDGTDFCVNGQTPCAGLASCGTSADCALGFVCAVGTCCGVNVCITTDACGGFQSGNRMALCGDPLSGLVGREWVNGTIAHKGRWVEA